MDALAMNSSSLDFQLLNDFQRDFPLVPAPFAELAARLGVGEKVVLGRLEKLRLPRRSIGFPRSITTMSANIATTCGLS